MYIPVGCERQLFAPQHPYFQVESRVDQSTETVESLFDENVGTDISSKETSSHRANNTPSLSQLLEERTPSTQSVVTCVRFSSSFFELLVKNANVWEYVRR